jgi:hypothetical protein
MYMQHVIKQWAKVASLLCAAFALAIVLLNYGPTANAQTAVTGAINGVVTDSTGAVVPNATVNVIDKATGNTRVLKSNSDGRYTAPFLNPSTYEVSATAPGLQSQTTSVTVLVGHQAVANIALAVKASKQIITVSAGQGQMIDTQSANLTTTFTTQQFKDLPMPGGDITTVAYSVPGVVVNAGGSYGNFSSDGLPGISNLFIINGADDNDPFLNLNNSGSSNLTIGADEIAQVSVVQNGYSVEYGRQAGVIVTYVTKSGTNRIHGLANWTYNSDGLNANDFFNNLYGTPKSKAVSNQYAAQIGGPAIKDKLFWFANTEGIRYILPVSGFVNFPTADLQNTILNTVPGGPTGQSASEYGQMFKLLQTAPSYGTAQPVTNGAGGLQDATGNMGCGTLAGTPVFGKPNTYFGVVPAGATGVAESCVNTQEVNATNLNREWFASTRVDYNLSDKHKIFARYTDDQGQQPTYTSFINPVLDAQSTQPSYSGQLNDTYIFSPNLTNQFIMSGLYYSAIFEPANISATLAASPTLFYEPSDGGTNSSTGFGQGGVTGFEWFNYPQGRNVTQYQFVDDLSWLKGNHNIKVGFNFKRDDVTDEGNRINTQGGYYYFGDAADFASGSLPGTANSNYNQSFSGNYASVYSALLNYGIYAQDEWKVTPRLVLDYGIRFDRTGNPLTNNNAFSRYQGGFPNTSATLSTPYNATIATGLSHAFPSVQTVVVQPRFGFSWDTTGQGTTVVRGGVGLFADGYPALIVGNEYGTFPMVFSPSVFAGVVGQGAGSSAYYANQANIAVTTGFGQGQNINQIAAAMPPGTPFSPPAYYTTPKNFVSPTYTEWSLQVQQQVTPSDAVIVSYAGNHGQNLLEQNNLKNMNQGGDTYINANLYNQVGMNFANLPLAPADPRFTTVRDIPEDGISNYNGASIEYKHIDRRGITADLSYTWSHALDDISNGGAGLGTNAGSVLSQVSPTSPSYLMYSNADYDIRNNLTADVTYAEPNRFANRYVQMVAAGWTVAGKAYWRSGEPFSVFNVNAENAINNGTGNGNYGANPVVLADVLNNNFNHNCDSFSQHCFQTPGIFNGQGLGYNSTFTAIVPVGPGPAPQTNFGNIPRNAFRGPHYSDIDLSAYKNIVQMSAIQFQIGAQAYNVMNHPNFGQPGNNASQAGSLGVISSDISAPTSPYGSFQGSAVSGRVLVVQGRLTF